MMTTGNTGVPAGFENRPDSTKAVFRQAVRQAAAPGMNFRPGRPPGGPGRMFGEIEKPQNAGVTMRRLLRYFGGAKKMLLGMLFSVVAVTLLSLASPALQGSAIDCIKDKNWSLLYQSAAALLGMFVLNVGAGLSQSLLAARISQHIVRRMRHDLFQKIINLPVSYLDSNSHGDIMSRMTNDVENVSNTVSQSLGSMISGVLTLIGTVTIMFIYCWQLTLVTMISVVLTVIITKKMSTVMRRIYKKRSEILGALNGHSEEMITGYRSIVSYNKQKAVTQEFCETSDLHAKVSVKAEILGGSMGPIMNCVSNIGFVIVAAFGGYFAYTGLITIGAISAFIIYAKQFSRPINEIAQLYGTIQTAMAGAERVFSLMDHPDEDNSGELPMPDRDGRISFRNVNFSYVPDKQILHDFSLEIEPGQKIALVGATGSGKTTVVNLLMRFYPVDSGEILIDGVNVTDLSRDALRNDIAIVLQDTFLFSDTIGNNIKYANLEASDQLMRQAADLGNISGYIERLPDQYETFLTHAGENLSHGQRQLIAIARAVLADPKILILDEATSSVDTRTEQNIQNAMVNLMKNRTSLIIAHRLSTVRDADQIVVMEGGRIVEVGDHESLLEKKGTYYTLYKTQFEGRAT